MSTMYSLVHTLVSLTYAQLLILTSLIVAALWSSIWTETAKQNNPPLVKHHIPYVGNAIAYGMDPYKFFADCKAKVELVS